MEGGAQPVVEAGAQSMMRVLAEHFPTPEREGEKSSDRK